MVLKGGQKWGELMARIEEEFDGISEAFDKLHESVQQTGLDSNSLARIEKIYKELKPKLPALDYAIRLLKSEPKLITGRLEFVVACGEVYGNICEIDAISHFGERTDKDFFDSYYASLNAGVAIQYLYWVLSHAHQKMCRLGRR